MRNIHTHELAIDSADNVFGEDNEYLGGDRYRHRIWRRSPDGFSTIVRPARYLQDLIESGPFAEFELPASAKRVITFLRRPIEPNVLLPIERDGVSILKLAAAEVFTAYVPGAKGPVFMNLLERTFGKDITTRTLDTVQKCARA